jgi:hypothetical protein
MLNFLADHFDPHARIAAFLLGNELTVLQDFTFDPTLLTAAMKRYRSQASNPQFAMPCVACAASGSWPSWPGEFHPEPLTDPDTNLSIHPARAAPRKPTGFRQDSEFLRLLVDSMLTWVTCLRTEAS